MTLFEQFLQDRLYLRNLSPQTLRFYRSRWTALPIELADIKGNLIAGIQRLQNRGVQNSSINDYLRAMKPYLRWCHEEGPLKERPKIQFLKCEQKVLATFNTALVQALLA